MPKIDPFDDAIPARKVEVRDNDGVPVATINPGETVTFAVKGKCGRCGGDCEWGSLCLKCKERPSFEGLFLDFATALAARSTCRRLHVGCVISSIDHRQVYAIGYNGNAQGGPNDCDRVGADAVGACGCIHSEANAIVNCNVDRAKDKIVYCTHLPCVGCAKLLINLGGVRRVIYRNDYRIRDSLDWFMRAGIQTHLSEG
jgi:dCMP deaminase